MRCMSRQTCKRFIAFWGPRFVCCHASRGSSAWERWRARGEGEGRRRIVSDRREREREKPEATNAEESASERASVSWTWTDGRPPLSAPFSVSLLPRSARRPNLPPSPIWSGPLCSSSNPFGFSFDFLSFLCRLLSSALPASAARSKPASANVGRADKSDGRTDADGPGRRCVLGCLA